MVLHLIEEGRTLIANKAAPIFISSEPEEPAIFCLNYASVLEKNTYNSGVLGH